MPNTFHRVGRGPHAVLVLHGWFGDAHAFAPIEPWLSTEAFSYVFMDQRGYGGMQGAHGEYSIAEIADDALALADTLGLTRFSVVGHSMGGMVMERIAIDAPARVRALVGIAPVPCGGIAYDATTLAFLEGAAQQLEHRRTIIDRSTGGRLPPAWIDWKARYSAACSSPEAFAAYLQAWAQTDFSAALRGTHPVKLLVGEHDPTFTATRMAQTYGQRYRSASIEVLANAGHYPMNETPLALVAAIESFLHSVAGSA